MQLTDEQRQMVIDNLGLAHFATNRFISFNADRDYDYEEVKAVSYYGLILAVMGYDPEHGQTFGTYAVKSIRRALYREFMYQYKTKINNASHLEDMAVDIDGEDSNWESYFPASDFPENEVIANIEGKRLIERVMERVESVTAKKVVILRYCYPDMSQTQIGKIAGCSQRYVGMVFQKLKDHKDEILLM